MANMRLEDKPEIAKIRGQFSGHRRTEADTMFRRFRSELTPYQVQSETALSTWQRVDAAMREKARYHEVVVSEMAGTDPEIYVRLAEVAKERTAKLDDELEWVKKNLKRPLREIEVAEIPSAFSVSILEMARADPNGFCQTMISRKLRGGEDENNGRNDGGKAIADTIAEIAAFGFESPSAPRTEELPEESGVPAVHGAEGE